MSEKEPEQVGDDDLGYRRHWRLEEDGTLSWSQDPYGPRSFLDDELSFEIEIVDPAFTASQIADELDQHACGLGDDEAFWSVCCWKVYRVQAVLDSDGITPIDYGPPKVVARLTPLDGHFQTTATFPGRAKHKDTRRLDERGCDHAKHCVASDPASSS